MEDLVGKQVVAFEFNSGGKNPAFVSSMIKFVGKTGNVVEADERMCKIQFPSDVDKFRFKWCYPTDEVLNNLVDKKVQWDITQGKSIKSIIEEVKSTIKDINKV
jgi:hypothetical protein